MAEWYYAKPGPITPMAVPGQRVAIWTPPLWTPFKVEYLEGLPRSSQLVFDLGPIAPNAQTNIIDLLNLKLQIDPPECAQLRFYPLDDFRIRLSRGASDVRFKVTNIVDNVDQFTIQSDHDLHTTEFVILKDSEPFAQGFNDAAVALVQSRIAFFGFRFILESLGAGIATVEQVERKYTPITFVAAGGM